jgi:hypothetical protein
MQGGFMSTKSRGLVMVGVGAVVVIVCLAADALGIGNQPGVGWKQLTGAAVGLITLVIGVVDATRR